MNIVIMVNVFLNDSHIIWEISRTLSTLTPWKSSRWLRRKPLKSMTSVVMLGTHEFFFWFKAPVSFRISVRVDCLICLFFSLDNRLWFWFRVTFTPTVEHCSMATIIGLCLRVKLMRSLPSRYKVLFHTFFFPECCSGKCLGLMVDTLEAK